MGSLASCASEARPCGGSDSRGGRGCLSLGTAGQKQSGVSLPGALCLSFPTQAKRPTSQGYLQTRLEARLERWVLHGQGPFSPSSYPVAWPLPAL